MTPTCAIETQELRKVFDQTVAVKGLTLQVLQGEVFGFLGPNGAGKTTSIKMLLGLTAPSAGSANLLGRPLGDREARRQAGFLPEHFRFHEWLNGVEFLTMHGQLCGLSGPRLAQRVRELLDRVGLGPHARKLLRTYSKGMLQRIGLAQALINQPRVVFLDEPTSGLDPVGRRLVRDIIHELRAQGTTVFLNSHLLSEVEVTCDRVAFIKHGEVVRVSDLKSLENGRAGVAIRAVGLTPAVLDGLAQWGGDIRADGERLTLTVESERALPEINRYLVGQGVEVYALTPGRLSLEELFIETIGKEGVL